MAITNLGYGDPPTWSGRLPYPEGNDNITDDAIEEKKRFYPQEVKKQILLWIGTGYDGNKIAEAMEKYKWFADMSDSTVGRYKRVLEEIENGKKQNELLCGCIGRCNNSFHKFAAMTVWLDANLDKIAATQKKIDDQKKATLS
jgi:hypothetical protein